MRTTQTVRVEVPEGLTPEHLQQAVHRLAQSRAAIARIGSALADQGVRPGVAAQLARVEELWQHIVETYGVYSAADVAQLRGGSRNNRSIATNAAKRDGLLAFTRGRKKFYPAFQFQGTKVHPDWHAVTLPLLDVGWDGEDVLLWMASPYGPLDGREPAALLVAGDGELLRRHVIEEARGVW